MAVALPPLAPLSDQLFALGRPRRDPAMPLQWLPETRGERRRRRRLLRACDALLLRLEDHNAQHGGDAPAPFVVTRAYALLGGRPGEAWARTVPSGAELHAAVLDLQDAWMRTEVLPGDPA